jgi:hypothetical protein
MKTIDEKIFMDMVQLQLANEMWLHLYIYS